MVKGARIRAPSEFDLVDVRQARACLDRALELSRDGQAGCDLGKPEAAAQVLLSSRFLADFLRRHAETGAVVALAPADLRLVVRVLRVAAAQMESSEKATATQRADAPRVLAAAQRIEESIGREAGTRPPRPEPDGPPEDDADEEITVG